MPLAYGYAMICTKLGAMSKFSCQVCGLSMKFDYLGQNPPFVNDFVILEDAYIMKDPFTSDKRCIILGSKCSMCQKDVCVSQDCSLFYSKRFCMPCLKANLDDFPSEIQAEVKRKDKD